MAEDKFRPYVMKDGTICRRLKVSESGRWMKIAGRYYTIPLICGIDENFNGDLALAAVVRIF